MCCLSHYASSLMPIPINCNYYQSYFNYNFDYNSKMPSTDGRASEITGRLAVILCVDDFSVDSEAGRQEEVPNQCHQYRPADDPVTWRRSQEHWENVINRPDHCLETLQVRC